MSGILLRDHLRLRVQSPRALQEFPFGPGTQAVVVLVVPALVAVLLVAPARVAVLMSALVAASRVRRRVPALVAVLRRKVAALPPRSRSVKQRVGKVPAIQGRATISKESITTSSSVLLVLTDAMADRPPLF